MNDNEIAAICILESARQLVLDRPVTKGINFVERPDGTRGFGSDPEDLKPGCRYCIEGAIQATIQMMGFLYFDNAARIARGVFTKFRYKLEFTSPLFGFASTEHINDPHRINCIFDLLIDDIRLNSTSPARKLHDPTIPQPGGPCPTRRVAQA